MGDKKTKIDGPIRKSRILSMHFVENYIFLIILFYNKMMVTISNKHKIDRYH